MPRTKRARLSKTVVLVLLMLCGITSAVPQAASALDAPQVAPDGFVTRTDGVEGRVISQANPLVDAEVWDIEFVGNTAFVAGKFLRVVKATSDWSRVEQPFLAAFDATTGEWLSGFRPTLDGPVWALEVGVNGDLLVGGEFTTVNGSSRIGLVSLDPSTGATNPTFNASVDRRYAEKLATIRDVHVDGNWVYAVGNFSHATDGSTTMQAGKVVRFNATTGTPDTTWVPKLTGRSGWAIDTSEDGQRVFLGGEFTYINGTADTSLYGAVDATTGALVPGYDNGFNINPSAGWALGGIVYDLAVAGDKVYLAGAEHYWESRSVANGASLMLTTTHDGHWFNDTQVAEYEGDKVYIGCHCLRHWGYANHDVDASTGAITGTLTAGMTGGEGVWAVSTAPDGCIWMGGDLRGTDQLRGVPEDGTQRWVGRFARFCGAIGTTHLFDFGTDTSATAPGWTKVTPNTNNALVSWSGAALTGRNRVGESHVQNRDLVFSSGAATFNVNLPNGTWRATVVMGDDESPHDNMVVRAEGLLIHDDVTNEVGTYQYVGRGQSGPQPRHFDVTVTDEQLNLTFSDDGGRDQNWVLNQIILEPIQGPVVDNTLIDENTPWLVSTEASWPSNWIAPAFDTAGWQQASPEFGYGDGDEQTTIDGSNRPAAVLGRAQFSVDDPADLDHLAVNLQVDDGATLWINGNPVLAHNIADGLLTAETLAETAVWGAGEKEWHQYLIPTSSLVAGTNTVAVSVHQSWRGSRDLGFNLKLEGATEAGGTLETPPNISVSGPAVLRPYAATSRYLVGTTDAPAGWTSVGFDDQTWTGAAGVLGIGEEGLDTELPPGNLTYYVRAEFQLDAGAAAAQATLDLLRDDGAVVYLNGQEVGRDNMPDGPIDSSTRAEQFVWGAAETTAVPMAIAPGILQAGTNVIAIEVHQAHPDSRDLRVGFQIRNTQ